MGVACMRTRAFITGVASAAVTATGDARLRRVLLADTQALRGAPRMAPPPEAIFCAICALICGENQARSFKCLPNLEKASIMPWMSREENELITHTPKVVARSVLR